MQPAPLVAYIRVSTSGQGRSGLGIEAQRRANVNLEVARGHSLAALVGFCESDLTINVRAALRRWALVFGLVVMAAVTLTTIVAHQSITRPTACARRLGSAMPAATRNATPIPLATSSPIDACGAVRGAAGGLVVRGLEKASCGRLSAARG